jgi:hypothetical protein
MRELFGAGGWRRLICGPAGLGMIMLSAGMVMCSESDGTTKAKATVDRLVECTKRRDICLVDLYADDAVLLSSHTTAAGKTQELHLPAPRFKAVLRGRLNALGTPLGEVVYSDCRYRQDAPRVRVDCTAQTVGEAKSHKESFLVGPDPAGQWIIFEQRWDTRE